MISMFFDIFETIVNYHVFELKGVFELNGMGDWVCYNQQVKYL